MAQTHESPSWIVHLLHKDICLIQRWWWTVQKNYSLVFCPMNRTTQPKTLLWLDGFWSFDTDGPPSLRDRFFSLRNTPWDFMARHSSSLEGTVRLVEQRAASEDFVSKFCGWWKHRALQVVAVPEGTISKTSHWLWYLHAPQIAATGKGIVTNFCHWFRDLQPCQGCAAEKGIISNSYHWIWDHHTSQRAAIKETTGRNFCHWILYLHPRQRAAV